MENIKVCGIVICALLVCIVFKNIKSEFSLFIRLAITIAITLISLAIFYPIISYIDTISKDTVMYKYIPILIKALGIALCVQITSEICKDAGESAIAERVNLFGKAQILVLSLPLIKNLLDLCSEIIN